MPDIYTHGHHESVLRSHTWRTAANSCAYLLPRLQAGMDLLDAGCGPGTITLDLARIVAPGRVLGVDASADIVAQADALRESSGAGNVEFRCGDVYGLDVDDASFDAVHAHQLLQHLTDPVAALREMRRVLRDGGVLGVRDGDYAAFAWAPRDPLLDRWLELYHAVTRRNGSEADAGRYLLGWVQAAGFRDAVASSSTWTFADPESRAWWGGLWADRVRLSSFATQAVEYGLSDTAELERIAGAWRRWAACEDGYFAVLHGEVVARRG
ncbi:MAG TPA: methyltransferase domain-containing protein [Candidatus Dormibacteraeota bacterium]|nr:methyltransferase domain-containing protein [Candidatus Dormibacteraeota bacterium]